MCCIKLNNRLFVAITFLTLLFVTPLSADTSENAVNLETLVITAEKSDKDLQTGDVDQEQLSSFFTNIERESFEGKMETLAEVIEKEAGIQVRRTGGLGSRSSVSLRGSSRDQVLIYMDGILLNDASGGGFDLSTVSLSDVDKVEIYKGITPACFSRASIGGVVNIRTLRSKKGLNGSITLGYGSFDTYQVTGFINHKPGNWDYLLSLDATGSKNDFDYINENNTPLVSSDDFKEKRNNADVEQLNFLSKAGFDFSDDARFELLNQLFIKEQDLPGWQNSEEVDTYLDTKRNITSLSFTLNNISRFRFNTRYSLEYSYNEEEYDDSGSHIGLGAQHLKHLTDRLTGKFFTNWATGNHLFYLIAAASREEYDPKSYAISAGNDDPVDPDSSRRITYEIGGQDSILLFNESLTLVPGFFFSVFDDRLLSGTDSLGKPEPPVTREDAYFSPQIGAKYQIAKWLRLKANAAKYVRPPSFYELFGDRGFFEGNMELKVEKGRNYDVGFEIYKGFTSISWINSITFNSVYFTNITDDLISEVYDSRGTGRAVNISGSEIKGIELSVKWNLFEHFYYILNATIQDSENKSELAVHRGKSLPGIADRSFLNRIEFRYRNIKLYTEHLIEDGMHYDPANLLEAEKKEEMNAGISCVYEKMVMTFTAKNLTDDLYEDFNGYPLPGRAFTFTLKYSF